MEIVGGLAFLGNYLNNRKDKETLENNKTSLKREKDTGDIYSREFFTKANKIYDDKQRKKLEDSKHPKSTGVIPKYYNFTSGIKDNINQRSMNYELFTGSSNDSENDDMQSSCGSSVQSNDPNFFLNAGNKISNNRRFENKITGKQSNNNGFLRQFDEMRFGNENEPVAKNVDENMGNAVNRLQNDRDISLGYSIHDDNNDMTYGVVDNEHFTHNNMQPFFKKRHGGISREHQGKISQRNVELFTGAVRPGWDHKQEREPLFNPTTNFTNIYGTPVMTDYYESRYIPSKERRNELPFQKVKVAPGLGLGTKGGQTTTVGTGDLYRVLPKTIDDLRPANKQQVTYSGVTKAGQKGTKGPIMGATEKRKPEQFKKYDPNDMVKTGGNISGPKLRGEYQKTGKWRGKKQSNYKGPAQYNVTQHTPNDMLEKHRESNKQSFSHSGPSNVYLTEGLRGRTNKLDETYIPDPTQRGKENNRQGGAGTYDRGNTYAFNTITNIPDATKRELYAENDRAGASMTGSTKTKVINYNDVPEATLRDIHNECDRAGTNMQGNMTKTVAFDPTDVMNVTLRDIHNQYDRSGSAVDGGMLKGQAIDYTDTLDPTLRNMHDQFDRVGKTVSGEVEKGQAYDPDDVPDVNMRNIHDKFDRNGKTVSGYGGKGKTYDPNDVPDINMRNIHDKYDRTGKTMSGYGGKGKTYDPNDVPDINMRNIHDKFDRNGKTVNSGVEKGKAWDPNDVPDINMRNIHDKYDRNGKTISGQVEKGKTYDPNDVPDITIREMTGLTNRAGAPKYNNDKPYVINYEDATPDITIREMTGHTNRPGTAKGLINKSYTINYEDATPDVTIREMTGLTNRSNPAKFDVSKERTRIDYANAETNTAKEEIARGRSPTQVKYNVGPVTDFTQYNFKNDNDMQIHRSGGMGLINESMNRLPRSYAKNRNETYYVNKRKTAFPQTSLVENPYINNVINKSNYNTNTIKKGEKISYDCEVF